MATDRTTFTMEYLERNPETVMRLTDCVTCSEHHGEDIKYYCKDHNVPCCGACYSQGHKTCCKVTDLKNELPVLLCNSKPDEIIADLKKVEIHLMKFMEFNEAIVDTVVPQIKRSMDEIREVRKRINDILDEIENHLTAEGSRIYKEVEKKKQNDNHHCLLLLHALRDSHNVLEAVHKHGSDLQKFLMTEKIRSQLRSYVNLVGVKYEKIETVSVRAELSSIIQSICSVSVSELAKLVSTVGYSILPFTGSQSQTKACQVQAVGIIELKLPIFEIPRYSDVKFLPGDRLMLVDKDNHKCILISSSYQFIASYPLGGIPLNICVLDDQEVAVSFLYGNNIHIMSVVGDVITPVRMIPTKYDCNGITSAGKGKMLVTWYCAPLRSEWSLMNTRGEVIHSHLYDGPYSKGNHNNRYVALNNAKTRLYISSDIMDSLLCLDMDGKRLFTYKPGNLIDPRGVAVDRYDNIYVNGHFSKNIHQLSPSGYVLRVIDSEVCGLPLAICIHESKDIMVVTNTGLTKILNIYQLT